MKPLFDFEQVSVCLFASNITKQLRSGFYSNFVYFFLIPNYSLSSILKIVQPLGLKSSTLLVQRFMVIFIGFTQLILKRNFFREHRTCSVKVDNYKSCLFTKVAVYPYFATGNLQTYLSPNNFFGKQNTLSY